MRVRFYPAHSRRSSELYSCVMWAAADINTKEIIVSVTVAELATFLARLLNPETVRIELQLGPERSSLHRFRAMRIELGDGCVRVNAQSDDVLLTGSREGFVELAEEVAAFADYNDPDEPGMHAHFDPRVEQTRHGTLARDSAPLIIVGPIPDDGTT